MAVDEWLSALGTRLSALLTESREPRAESRELFERIESGDGLPEDERVHVVRPLVSVHALEVRHVAHRAVLGENAVRAEQAARFTGDVRRHVDVVALRE